MDSQKKYGQGIKKSSGRTQDPEAISGSDSRR